ANLDRELEAEIQALVAEFRRASSRPLVAAAPTTVPELRAFVLETIREAAEAEVAILNLGALHKVDETLLERLPLTVEAVRRLLPLDQFLVAGDLSGSQLVSLAGASSRRRGKDGKPLKSSLLFAGLGRSDAGKLEVNGRPLYSEDRYRVVTNSFLASGGDDYAALTQIVGPQALRTTSGRLGEVRESYVLPRLDEAERPFPDLEKRGLWRFGVDRLGISFEGVETSADDSYRDALDSRASADDSGSLLAMVRLRADQEWRSFRWENRLRGRFGLVDAEGEERGELEDDLRLEISGLFTKAQAFGGRFYTSLIIDSEFRRNERRGVTLPRQLELNLAAGLRWQAGPWSLIRFGVVARHQEDFEDADRLGLFAEGEFAIVGRGRRPGFSGRLFAESLDNSAATIRRVDAELALEFPIVESLAFTPELNFYLYDDSRLPGAARYHRLSLGLTYAWNGKHQRR
ncbi:MAG: 5'-nucleotidase C-terminal domain-containing protein, partial [Acidobacteriota bacterium]